MESQDNELRRVLEEIRDDQRTILARNEELLNLTRDQFEVVKRHYDRAEKLQDRAEQLQARGEGLVGGARKAFYVIVPILIALVIYVSWLLFRLVL
jgi:hypothetical protein